MPYTTLELLRQRMDSQVLAGLADDVNTPPSLSDSQTIAVIEQAIADGADRIESILGAQLDLSDAAARAALERLNATLALYYLFQRRSLGTEPRRVIKGAVACNPVPVPPGSFGRCPVDAAIAAMDCTPAVQWLAERTGIVQRQQAEQREAAERLLARLDMEVA